MWGVEDGISGTSPPWWSGSNWSGGRRAGGARATALSRSTTGRSELIAYTCSSSRGIGRNRSSPTARRQHGGVLAVQVLRMSLMSRTMWSSSVGLASSSGTRCRQRSRASADSASTWRPRHLMSSVSSSDRTNTSMEQRGAEPSVFVVTVDAKASEQCDRLRGPLPCRIATVRPWV